MQKKVEYLHLRQKSDSREVQKPAVKSTKTVAAVRQFKSRAQLIQEKIEQIEADSSLWFEEFSEKIFKSYKIGNFNSDFESNQFFSNAVYILGQALCKLNFDQAYSEELFNSDINGLNMLKQFHRSLIGFMIDMDDRRNIGLIKFYLKRLQSAGNGDDQEIGDLIDNLDDILFALKELITHGYLDIDLSFYNKLTQ